ncbi:MAG: bacteriohopanetetrol glucosamine biosynthesis glycosyltransferase HpnI [Rhizomicrobium sp.]|jgi:ceramide glucosyltransferase
MEFLGALLVWSLTALAVVSVAYTLIAASLIRGQSHAARPTVGNRPGVTLLKPLYLSEVGLAENLRSFFEQDYDGPLQIVFGFHSPSDPAMRVAERLRAEYPEREVAFVVDTNFEGVNPKVANLINMVGHARHEILIASDSDIRVPGNYVRTLVAELAGPNVGAVTCLYRGKPAHNLWSALEAMFVNFAFLPNVILGTTFRLTAPCFGSTIALRQSVLREIGGFKALSLHLADDYEIGRAVRSRGYQVKISSLLVDHICEVSGIGGLLRHETRWARTVRVLNAPGHLGSIITHPLPLALMAAPFVHSWSLGLTLIAAALTSRLWLAWRVQSRLDSPAGSLWLLPFRDLLSFAIFIASFFGNSVYWRGTRYLTGADGVLAQR